MSRRWYLTVRGLVEGSVRETLRGHVTNLDAATKAVTERVVADLTDYVSKQAEPGGRPAIILDGEDGLIFGSVFHKG